MTFEELTAHLQEYAKVVLTQTPWATDLAVMAIDFRQELPRARVELIVWPDIRRPAAPFGDYGSGGVGSRRIATSRLS